MGFYWNVVFPRLCDCLMDKPQLAKHRRQLLASAGGKILEIGVGTGLNIPHYPEHVRQIAGVDPNPGVSKLLRKRTKQRGMKVDHRVLGGEQLPFEDATFDCVVSTWTLCSIQDIERAMRGLYRVLRPGGRFLFMEHGVSDEESVRRWQVRLNPFQMRIAGCRLDLNVRDLFCWVPFASVEIENFYLERIPKTHGYMYRGVATK